METLEGVNDCYAYFTGKKEDKASNGARLKSRQPKIKSSYSLVETGGGQPGLELNPSQAILSLLTGLMVRCRAQRKRSPAGLEGCISTEHLCW